MHTPNWIALGSIMFCALMASGCSPSLSPDPQFRERDIDLATYGLFDLGVVDANQDGLLDVFTSNHSGRQSLALNQGAFRFEDSFGKWGIDQDPEFPGLVVAPNESRPNKPGLYVNRRGRETIVRSHLLAQSEGPLKGTIELFSSVVVEHTEGFEVSVAATELPSGATRSFVTFSGKGDGHFVIAPHTSASPVSFEIKQGVEAEQIYVGPNYISPKFRKFAIRMRDRHGMAWARYDDDTKIDLFIARGGEKGTMSSIPVPFWDELYVYDQAGYVNIGERVGLAKRGCPGRQTAWTDYNADGLLDLYVVCGRGDKTHENQLLRQTSAGGFVDLAEETGLDIGPEGKFLWIDFDNDGDLDFFWAGRNEIDQYTNNNGNFVLQRLVNFNKSHNFSGIRPGDVDSDGDLDLLAVSPQGNQLLINDAAVAKSVNPLDLGLPQTSTAASWVDVNNDGVLELYSLPGGIYSRQLNGQYVCTNTLHVQQPAMSLERMTSAYVTWFDANNDGTRDLLVALRVETKRTQWARWAAKIFGPTDNRRTSLRGRWFARLYENAAGHNHWMQIDLQGPPGNREAIGARVELRAGDTTQIQAVGHAEGAHYSQGHYRLYFGLGTNGTADLIRLRWPDGHVKELRDIPGDQLLVVRRDVSDENEFPKRTQKSNSLKEINI